MGKSRGDFPSDTRTVRQETLVENIADSIAEHIEDTTQVDAFESHCTQLLASLTRDGHIEGDEK